MSNSMHKINFNQKLQLTQFQQNHSSCLLFHPINKSDVRLPYITIQFHTAVFTMKYYIIMEDAIHLISNTGDL